MLVNSDEAILLPVQSAAVGSVRQLLTAVTSVVRVEQVDPSHLSAKTVGKAVGPPYTST